MHACRSTLEDPTEILLAAAAEVHGLIPEALLERARDPRQADARALFLKLGELESYGATDLGAFLGIKRSRSYLLRERPVPERALRIARTLIRTPVLRPVASAAALRAMPAMLRAQPSAAGV